MDSYNYLLDWQYFVGKLYRWVGKYHLGRVWLHAPGWLLVRNTAVRPARLEVTGTPNEVGRTAVANERRTELIQH